jgi:hypothetical protein
VTGAGGSWADGGGAGGEAGLLASMAAAQEQGERLSEGELYANAILLRNAGHETPWRSVVLASATGGIRMANLEIGPNREKRALSGNEKPEMPSGQRGRTWRR